MILPGLAVLSDRILIGADAEPADFPLLRWLCGVEAGPSPI